MSSPIALPWVWLKAELVGVVDAHEFANLFLVEHLARRKGESIHIGDRPYKERISIEGGLVVHTHEYTITRLISRMIFGLRRDPPLELEV